jgi:hypothetical protein
LISHHYITKNKEISVSTHLQTLKNKTGLEASPVTEMDTLDSIRGPKGLFNCSVVRSGNLTGGFADGQSLISASSSVIGFIQILPIARPIKQKR